MTAPIEAMPPWFRRSPSRALVAVSAALCVASSPGGPPEGDAGAPGALVRHVAEHRDGSAPWSIEFDSLKPGGESLPIGVFDSGIGGLTVLEAILGLDAFKNGTLQPGGDGVPDFAGERFIYFGDQANMPYGNYPSQGREDYLRELILKDVVFLLGTRWREAPGAEPRADKPPVKAIVIACNTATAYGLDDIRGALQSWGIDVPVIGIIEAGARAAVELVPKEGGRHSVGVLATVGTCSSNAYPRAIARAAGLGGKPVPVVVQQGSVGLAGAIEGNPAYVWSGPGERPVSYAGPVQDGGRGLNSIGDYARHDIRELLGKNREELARSPMDLLVLGCTHFPLAQRELSEALESARREGGRDAAALGECLARELRFVDPAEHTAKELFRELARRRVRSRASQESRFVAGVLFYFSVPRPGAEGVRLAADGSLDADYKAMRSAGRLDVEDTAAVPLTPGALPRGVEHLVRSLPATWAELNRPAR